MTTLSYRGDVMPKRTFFNLKEDKHKRIIDSAMDEFSNKTYEQVNLSEIIKNAKIPRGSFYQYFEDKEDLYMYLIELGRNAKMEYLKETLQNKDEIPFMTLVRKLFEQGIMFALNHENYVKLFDLLLKNKNYIYDKIIAENIEIAIKIYGDLIEKDKQKGLIRQEINTQVFAKMIVELTTNITVDDLDLDNTDLSYQHMKEKINQLLLILEKGVIK